MPFRPRHHWSLLGLLVLLAAVPAGAQEPGAEPLPDRNVPGGKPQKPPPVAMEVQVGLKVGEDFYARKGQATPVRVVLDNNDKAVTGHLEVRNWRRRGVTRMPIDLPRRAHKEYTLYVPLARNPEHPEGASGEVLLFAGRKVLGQKLLKPKFPEGAVLVMSATGDDSGLQFLTEGQKYSFPGETDRSLYASHVAPRDLPRSWPGYHPADVVTLNGRAWTEMDDEQRRALRMWVEQGGRAVLCSGGPTEWRDPEALALTGVIGRDPVSDPELRCVSPWAGQPYRAREGTILTVTGPLQPGAEATWKEEGRPLIVTRQAVAGRVIWLGFDPFTQSFREWNGSPRFWRQLLDWARRQDGTDPYHTLGEVETARTAANSLPRLPAPPLAAIVAFGVIYALIFGPLNIWMLRRLRRTVRSWLFVPALALGMTLIVLGVGQSWATRGRS